MKKHTVYRWAVLLRSENRLDGKTEKLALYHWPQPKGPRPRVRPMMLFDTRQAARDYAKEQYGYIRDRPDLKAEPHGWKPPKIVKVKVEFSGA